MSSAFRINNLENDKKHPTRWYSDKQEKKVAKIIEGKQTKNSGATIFQKSDVLTSEFVLECKTKTSNSESISIKKEWFDKLTSECVQMGKKYSAIVINFGPDKPYNENHYIIDEYLFRELIEYLKQNHN